MLTRVSDYDESDDTPGFYIAADTSGNAYFMVYCSIEDIGGKVFLVKDSNDGASILQKPELQPVITGGVTKECVPIALKSTFAGY